MNTLLSILLFDQQFCTEHGRSPSITDYHDSGYFPVAYEAHSASMNSFMRKMNWCHQNIDATAWICDMEHFIFSTEQDALKFILSTNDE